MRYLTPMHKLVVMLIAWSLIHSLWLAVPVVASVELKPIAGKVVDAKGKPLEDVTVYLRRRPFRYHAGPLELAQQKTTADGQFVFQNVHVPDPGDPEPINIFPIDVIVTKPGHAIRWRRLTNAKTDLIFQLKKEERFAGIVKDDAGMPVAGVKIRVNHIMSLNTITKINIAEGQEPSHNGDSFVNIARSTAEISAKTNDQGRFELRGLPDRVGLVLSVDDERFVVPTWYAATTDEVLAEIHAGKLVVPPRSNEVGDLLQRRPYSKLVSIHNSPATLTIIRGVQLQFRLVDASDGAPVSGAEVALWTRPKKIATTAENGTCRFPQLEPGSEIHFRVTPPVDAPLLAWRETIQLTGKLSDERVIQLPSGVTVDGQVIDVASRLGLADARLSYNPAGGLPRSVFPPTAVSDNAGAFTLTVPQVPGHIVLRIAPPGYTSAILNKDDLFLKPSADQPIEALKIELQRRPAIPFRFVDSRGASVASKATIRTFFSSNSYREMVEEIAQDGMLDVSKLVQGDQEITAIQILVRSLDDRLAGYFRSKDIEGLTGQQPKQIELLPTATVRGRILHAETNEPIEEAKVSLIVSYTSRGGQQVGNFVCDQKGCFVFERLVPGMRYSIGASAGSFRPKNAIHTQFHAESDGQHEVDISLIPNLPRQLTGLGHVSAVSVEGLSPEQAYTTLVEEFRKADEAYDDLLREHRGRGITSQIVALREPTPAYAEAMLKLANANRGTEVEFRALKWLVKTKLVAGTEHRFRDSRNEAAARLLAQHANSPNIADAVANIIYASPDRYEVAETFRNSPHHEVRGRATLVLANMLAQSYEDRYRGGQEQLRQRAIELYEEIVSDYADIKKWRNESIAVDAKYKLIELRDLQIGSVAPEIEGRDLRGKPMKLSDFRGKVVVIHYWQSGLNHFSRLEEMAEEYKDRPLVILGVNTDSSLDKAQAALATTKLKIRHWHDPQRKIHRLWSGSWPSIHVIGHDGIILYRGQRRSPRNLEDVLDKAVGEAAR